MNPIAAPEDEGQAKEIQEKKEAQGLQSICKKKETCTDVHLIRLILHRYRYRPSSSPLDSTTTRVEDKKQGEIKNLKQKQLFWAALFEEKKLASQLASIATKHVEGITYDDMPQYGQIHVKVESDSTLGDNFQSDTFIVTAQLTRTNNTVKDDTSISTLSTIVKVLPSNSFLRQAAYKMRTHPREISMYHNLFRLLREVHEDEPIPLDDLIPDVYYSHIEDIIAGETDGSGTCTLLENLKAEGYLMADKVEGADLRHCHMALTSLAHYHALTLSAVRKWKDPATGKLSQVPSCAKFLVEEKTFYEYGMEKYIKNSFKYFLDFVHKEERPDLGEWLAELLQRLPEIILVDTLESSGPLACILHGDYWINNMLFKYHDESHTQVGEESSSIPLCLKMINFQVSRIGHPLSDVLYFFYTSTKPETREKHMLVLLCYYFGTLDANLLLLGVSLDDYTWQDFLADYKKRSLMWMFMGVMVLSGLLKSVSNLQDLDAEEKLKGPKPETNMETIKGEMGISLEMEETMKNMMVSYELSDSSILSESLIKLMDEVKALNCC